MLKQSLKTARHTAGGQGVPMTGSGTLPHGVNMQNAREQFNVMGKVRIVTYKAGTKKVLSKTPWFKNLVVSSSNYGRNIIVQRLAGTNTYSLNITHGEIGTGTTAPTNGDTGLVAGVKRVATTYTSIINNVLLIQFFMPDNQLANGSYNEFGTFIDGSATLGSGQLFNRVVFTTTYVKSSGEDTTVEVQFTIT